MFVSQLDAKTENEFHRRLKLLVIEDELHDRVMFLRGVKRYRDLSHELRLQKKINTQLLNKLRR